MRYVPDGIWPVQVNGWGVLSIFLLTLLLASVTRQVILRRWLSKVSIGEWITSRVIGGPPPCCLQAFSAFPDR